MTDTLRVKPPKPAASVIYNGQRYTPDARGVAHIPDDGKLRQAKGATVLPVVSVSPSHLDLPELACTVCRRRKLALMGPVCGWCGGECRGD